MPKKATEDQARAEADAPVELTPEEQEAEFQRQLDEEVEHGHPAFEPENQVEDDSDGV